jgi:hypothetical protein
MIAGRTCATALLAAPAWLLRSGSTSAQLTEIPPVAQSEAEQIADRRPLPDPRNGHVTCRGYPRADLRNSAAGLAAVIRRMASSSKPAD